MRIAIDFCVDRNEVLLMSEVTDNTCMESCINFNASNAETITVHLVRNGETVETVLHVVHCSACFVMDDAIMRTPGEFTIFASGCTPLRFIVGEAIPAGVEYYISLTNGAFYVRCAATIGGGGSGVSPCYFQIDDSGDLILHYIDGADTPNMSINSDGDLIWTV